MHPPLAVRAARAAGCIGVAVHVQLPGHRLTPASFPAVDAFYSITSVSLAASSLPPTRPPSRAANFVPFENKIEICDMSERLLLLLLPVRHLLILFAALFIYVFTDGRFVDVVISLKRFKDIHTVCLHCLVYVGGWS